MDEPPQMVEKKLTTLPLLPVKFKSCTVLYTRLNTRLWILSWVSHLLLKSMGFERLV